MSIKKDPKWDWVKETYCAGVYDTGVPGWELMHFKSREEKYPGFLKVAIRNKKKDILGKRELYYFSIPITVGETVNFDLALKCCYYLYLAGDFEKNNV